MTIAREEIFGPVLSMLTYDSEEKAIQMANDTVYGLSGYVQSGSIEHARKVAARIRSGNVHINGAGADFTQPFGGYKQSGNGRRMGRARLRGIPRDQGRARLRRGVSHPVGNAKGRRASGGPFVLQGTSYGVARANRQDAKTPRLGQEFMTRRMPSRMRTVLKLISKPSLRPVSLR
jgi:hypothetical protein